MAAIVYDIETKKPKYADDPDGNREVEFRDLKYFDQIAFRKTKRTPDYRTLKFQQHIPLFAYGNLKSGGPYSKLLDKADYLGEALTGTLSYQMKYYEGVINQPILRRCNPNDMQACRVMGEVYAVTPEMILEIDEVLEHTEMFQRENVFVSLLDQTYPTKDGDKHPVIKAVAYLATKYWDGLTLKNCKTFKQGGKNFYEWDAWLNQCLATGYMTAH